MTSSTLIRRSLAVGLAATTAVALSLTGTAPASAQPGGRLPYTNPSNNHRDACTQTGNNTVRWTDDTAHTALNGTVRIAPASPAPFIDLELGGVAVNSHQHQAIPTPAPADPYNQWREQDVVNGGFAAGYRYLEEVNWRGDRRYTVSATPSGSTRAVTRTFLASALTDYQRGQLGEFRRAVVLMSAAATNAAIRTGSGAAIAGIAMAGIEHHGSTYSLAAAVCAAVVGGATNAATTVRDWFAARQLAVYFFGQLPR